MADNTPRTPGSGMSVATDEASYSGDTAHVQIHKPVHVAGSEGSKTVESVTQTAGSATPAAAIAIGGSDGTNLRILKTDSGGALQVDVESTVTVTGAVGVAGLAADGVTVSGAPVRIGGKDGSGNTQDIMTDTDGNLQVDSAGFMVTVTTDVTRPADTTAYAINDAISNSTSAPTSGGFTWTSAARQSGGSGIITDVIVTSSNDPGTQLQGEIFVFDQAVTNINDNAAFAVTDAEIKTCIGVIPFTLEDVGNNGFYHAKNLNIGFTCNGSANLRFLIRAKNAYTPASAEVFTFVAKIVQVT